MSDVNRGSSLVITQPLQGSLLAEVPAVPGWLRRRASQLTSGPYSEISAPASDIEAARSWLPVLRALIPERATDQEIDDQLDIMKGLAWKVPDSLAGGDDTREAVLFRGAFKSDLKHLPAEVLAAGCRAARLDPARRFFPTTGELLAYAQGTDAYRAWAAQLREVEGVRRLSEAKRERPKEDTTATPEMWAALRARLEGKNSTARRDHDGGD